MEANAVGLILETLQNFIGLMMVLTSMVTMIRMMTMTGIGKLLRRGRTATGATLLHPTT